VSVTPAAERRTNHGGCHCGFRPRCALELDDSAEVRIDKILRKIAECRFGVHDLSRTELDAASALPRFNMPLELGLSSPPSASATGAGPRLARQPLDAHDDPERQRHPRPLPGVPRRPPEALQ
jgi:hypothetical protein